MFQLKNVRFQSPISSAIVFKNLQHQGSGCYTVGRVIAAETNDLQFESSHRQFLFPIYCIEKSKIKKKVAGKGTLINTSINGYRGEHEERVNTFSPQQCDQIGQFFAFWASIQSRLQK